MQALNIQSQQDEFPQAILFDWDNTLVNNKKTTYQAFNTVLKYYGRPQMTLEPFLNRPQLSVKDSFPKTFGEEWEEVRRLYYELYEKIHLTFLAPLPGTQELLAYLEQNNVCMAVVSNKNGNFLRKEVEFLKWTRYFKAVIGSDDAEDDKPSPQPVRLALGSMGIVASKDIFFVGDSVVDVECAHNSGCTPILLKEHGFSGSFHEKGLMKFPDWYAFGRYLGLEKHIERFN